MISIKSFFDFSTLLRFKRKTVEFSKSVIELEDRNDELGDPVDGAGERTQRTFPLEIPDGKDQKVALNDGDKRCPLDTIQRIENGERLSLKT